MAVTMLPRAKAPTRRPRVVAQEDAHPAEAGRLVDLGRDEAHGAGDLAEAGHLDARRLADALMAAEPRLDHLGVQLHLALGDDAEHRLGGARGVAADARHAPADDAVGRGRHLDAPAPPRQLAALRLHLRPLGLRHLQPVLRGGELRLGRAGGLLALIEHGLRHVAGLAQRLGALVGVAALDEARLGLHDGGLGLGDGGGRAGERRVVLGELGVERVGHQARQHVALLHALALVGQHLGDAQALDLGPHQDLLARHQRAGGEHRLGELGRG